MNRQSEADLAKVAETTFELGESGYGPDNRWLQLCRQYHLIGYERCRVRGLRVSPISRQQTKEPAPHVQMPALGFVGRELERVKGIEPSNSAWKSLAKAAKSTDFPINRLFRGLEEQSLSRLVGKIFDAFEEVGDALVWPSLAARVHGADGRTPLKRRMLTLNVGWCSKCLYCNKKLIQAARRPCEVTLWHHA